MEQAGAARVRRRQSRGKKAKNIQQPAGVNFDLDLSKYGDFVQPAGPGSIDLSMYGDFVQDASGGMVLDSIYGPLISKRE